ncbi:MAG: hypothetical protein QF886_23655, partial [Planctomycetota bacterium]|nr:hypothetical protein [Planctomycetota bacterium]
MLGTASVSQAKDLKDVRILVYAAYGTPNHLYVTGRVLEGSGRKEDETNQSKVKTLFREVKSFLTAEVEELPLQFRCEGTALATSTDDEGLFDVKLIALDEKKFTSTPQTVLNIEITDRSGKYKNAKVSILPTIVSPGSLVIVSDFDDTVVHSNVTEKHKLILSTLMKNPKELKAVPGPPELYRALEKSGRAGTPFFYLSGSPVNLFEKLVAYMTHNRFPLGPAILKNLGM